MASGLLARGAHSGCPRQGRSQAPAQPARRPLGAPRLQRRRCRGPARPRATQEADQEEFLDEEELEKREALMEEFLMKQEAKESGSLVADKSVLPEKVVGADAMSEEDAKRMCREVRDAVSLLREQRDMSLTEVKLTLAIDDPGVREEMDAIGIEDESGASRDEVAAALLEVAAGRIPKDRIALKELHREMQAWPFLREGGDDKKGPAAAAAEVLAPVAPLAEAVPEDWTAREGEGKVNPARPKVMRRDKSLVPQSLEEMLPDWVGYGFLYLVSITPVLIAGTVIAILFFNSLR